MNRRSFLRALAVAPVAAKTLPVGGAMPGTWGAATRSTEAFWRTAPSGGVVLTTRAMREQYERLLIADRRYSVNE